MIKFLLLALGLVLAGYAQAQTFQCRDADGGVRFQDRPCAGMVPFPAHTAAAEEAPQSPAAGKHFFWQASSGNGTLYLLGSIHFGTAEMYPLPQSMTRSFKQADALVVEADVLNADPLQMAQLVAGKAFFQDGARLRDHLSPPTWQRLEQVSASLGMPATMLDMQKPWFVSMTLTAQALQQLGFSEEQGIDVHFLKLAHGKKKVIELESLAMQLSLFEQLSMDEQVMMLEETLREIEHGDEFFAEMLGYWRRGDADGIQRLFDEGMMSSKAGERLNQIIMTERNLQMTEKLHALAEQGGRYFVVVGAGHLAGAEGIVTLLRQRGYRVEQQ